MDIKVVVQIEIGGISQASDIAEIFEFACDCATEGYEIQLVVPGKNNKVTAMFAMKNRTQKNLEEDIRLTAIANFSRQAIDSIGFEELAPRAAKEVEPLAFTPMQGQYLAFIHQYSKVHHQAPAFADFERKFRTAPSSVNQMIKNLEKKGFIEKTPGAARSIRLLVSPSQLPGLK